MHLDKILSNLIWTCSDIVLNRRLVYTLRSLLQEFFYDLECITGPLVNFWVSDSPAEMALFFQWQLLQQTRVVSCKSSPFTQHSTGSTALLLPVKQDWEPSVWEIKFSLLLNLINDNKKWLHVSLVVSSQGILKQAHLPTFSSEGSDFIFIFAHVIKQISW